VEKAMIAYIVFGITFLVTLGVQIGNYCLQPPPRTWPRKALLILGLIGVLCMATQFYLSLANINQLRAMMFGLILG